MHKSRLHLNKNGTNHLLQRFDWNSKFKKERKNWLNNLDYLLAGLRLIIYYLVFNDRYRGLFEANATWDWGTENRDVLLKEGFGSAAKLIYSNQTGSLSHACSTRLSHPAQHKSQGQKREKSVCITGKQMKKVHFFSWIWDFNLGIYLEKRCVIKGESIPQCKQL